jgi:hypothetical protein
MEPIHREKLFYLYLIINLPKIFQALLSLIVKLYIDAQQLKLTAGVDGALEVFHKFCEVVKK